MSNISQYSTTAANNNSAAPNGFPEGMAPSGVNDAAREVMAALAKWYSDTDASLTSGGTGNAYTLTSNSSHAALADQSLLVFRADRANTGSATLNVDSLGAKTMQLLGSNLASGDIVADQVVAVAYNATNDTYDVLGGIINHDALTGFVANEHVDHSSVSLSAGTGISSTGLGDLTASRTINAQTASTSQAGVLETATEVEARTGTDATRAVSPDSLAGVVYAAWADVSGPTFFKKSAGASGWTLTKNTTGKYTVTHSFALGNARDLIPTATCETAFAEFAAIQNPGANSFDVWITDTNGSFVDADFTVTAIRAA